MSDEEIEFEYDDEDGLVSELSYGSDEDMEALDYTMSSQKESSGDKHFKAIGCSDCEYIPWSISEYVDQKLLQPVRMLKSSQLPNCSFDDLLVMLQYKRWQSDELILDFIDNPALLYEKAGLPYPDPPNNTFKTVTQYDCSICCESYPRVVVYSLSCNSDFCINCYYNYVTNQVRFGLLVTCIDPTCSLVIPHKDIDQIISQYNDGVINTNAEVSKENPLLVTVAMNLINSKKTLAWCPGVDCNDFAEIVDGFEELEPEPQHLKSVPIVRCSNSHEFCFNCKYENHLPCPCWIVRKWIKKCNDDSETANWIDVNTHACPKCDAAIEKNGGCNQMTCSECHHMFCWICMKDWTTHKNYYNCNLFQKESKENEKVNKKRLSLQRYLHYYKRYATHESSVIGDLKIINKIEALAKAYMETQRLKKETDLSWNDIQFLTDAIKSLTNGRKALKWTYCFAFYLESSNFGDIFEDNQNYLNQTVEELSAVFQQINSSKNEDKLAIILKEQKKIINLSSLIRTRQKRLIEGCNENLINDLIKFA